MISLACRIVFKVSLCQIQHEIRWLQGVCWTAVVFQCSATAQQFDDTMDRDYSDFSFSQYTVHRKSCASRVTTKCLLVCLGRLYRENHAHNTEGMLILCGSLLQWICADTGPRNLKCCPKLTVICSLYMSLYMYLCALQKKWKVNRLSVKL